MDIEKKGNTQERVLTSFVMPANLWPLIKALPTARSQWLALMAINAYGYEGIETDTEDASANAVLASAIIQIDAMRGREQRPERGAKDAPTKGGRRGNPNFTKGRTNPYYRDNSRSQLSLFNELKHNKLNKDNSKIIQGDNNLSINELYKDNSEIIRDNSGDNSTPFNELKHSELDNDNSTIRKKEKKEESLDNTSPSTELVLSKQKEKIKEKEKAEPALATGEGGAGPSFSTAGAVLTADAEKRHGAQSMPQPSAPIDTERKDPHTPSPRSPEYKCAERFLRGIEGHDALYDDSKEAEIEREKTRKAKLIQLREMETDPLQRSAITEIINSIRIVA